MESSLEHITVEEQTRMLSQVRKNFLSHDLAKLMDTNCSEIVMALYLTEFKMFVDLCEGDQVTFKLSPNWKREPGEGLPFSWHIITFGGDHMSHVFWLS